jgi:hypothetical protein
MGSGWPSLHFSDRACSWQQCPASLKGFIFGHCRDGSVSYWLLYLFAIHALVHEGVLHGELLGPQWNVCTECTALGLLGTENSMHGG